MWTAPNAKTVVIHWSGRISRSGWSKTAATATMNPMRAISTGSMESGPKMIQLLRRECACRSKRTAVSATIVNP